MHIYTRIRGDCGVMVIIVGNGHSKLSSNAGCVYIFTNSKYPWERCKSNYSPSS